MRASALVPSLRRALAAGWSIGDLAALYRIDRAEVRRIVAGPAPRRRANPEAPRRRARRDATIRALRSAGWSVAALADRFGLAESTVSTIARGLGARDPDPADPPLVAVVVAVGPPSGPARDAAPFAVDSSSPASESWGDDVRRGSAHGRAKLSEATVAELRRLRAEGWTYPALAERFGISRSNVWYVLSGRTWNHVGAV